MGNLLGIPEWIGWVMLALSTLLAINAGRSLAARRHDAELAKRYGRGLSFFGLALYFYAIFSIIFSLFSMVTVKSLTTSLRLLTTGSSIAPIITGFIYPLLVTGASYAAFRARYRNVGKPLTREGRMAMKLIKKEVTLQRKVIGTVRKTQSLHTIAKMAGTAEELTKSLIKDKDKED